MEPTILLVETRAVQRGKIAIIGRLADVENLTGPGTTVRQLHGLIVMPGLVESHTRALQVFVALHGGTGAS